MSTIGAPSTWEVLTDSLDSSQMAESDILLEDFLNDKLQSAADLDNIASLIEKVENQTKLLEEQQETARIELETAKKASEEHIISMNKLIADFENQQENIDGRMMTVTKSQIPVDAVERLEEPMEKLRRLELAEEYVKLLTDINALAQEARDHLPGDPKSSLRPYTRLKEISLALKKGQEAVEGAAIHLVDYAENITTQLWKQMSKIMIDELLNLSRKELAWPNSSLSIPTNNATERWNKCFTKLLVLQAPELTAFIETPLVLLPMKALAMEHTRAFRYHYMSDKESSNPHHLGELFFPWIISKVKDLEDFLRKEVSPVLQAHFMGSELSGNTLYTDAVSAFITALLPVVREKVFNVMSELDNQPQLMSQFVEELLAFDSSLRGEPFNYTGGNITYGWNGLTWEVMQVWFDRWSEHAKDFALRRYEEIVSDPQNGLIDYESIGPGKTKPTSGVIKVVDLLKTVTEQYKHLGRFSHKVRFLIHIQVAILDEYHERLQGSLNVYQSYSTPLGRTLHGLTKEQEAALSGNGALESLCKVYGSADYVIHALQEWSNEQFFIELWNELQRRARATTANQTIAGPMTVNQVKNITSTALGAPDEDGAMFDETIDSYKSLRTMSERYIIDKIRNGFQISFRPYLVKPDWHGHTDDPIDIPSLSVTAELDRPLETLRADMMFLKGVLSAVPFRRIWRECLKSLEDHLYGELLMRQQYTALGAVQFKRDVSEICDVIEDASRDVKGTAFDMPRLKEAVDVLTLPVQAENGRLSLKEAFHFTHTTPDIEPIVSQLRLKVLQPREIRALVELRLEVGAYE